VSHNFGKTTAAWDRGDFNYDGSVNLSDLLTLTRHFGKSIPAPTIVTAEASLAAATSPLSDPLSIRRRR